MTGELILTSDTYDQGRVAINNSFSGTANLNNLLLDSNFSGGTGGGKIYSAGTDLYNIFIPIANSGTTGFSGWTSSTGVNSIVSTSSTGNIASARLSIATGSGTTASGIVSSAGGIFANSNNYAEWSMSSGQLGQHGFVSYFGTTTFIPFNVSELFLDGGSFPRRFTIPLNSSYFVNLTINARKTNGESATWTSEGMIRNIGGVVSLGTDIVYGIPFNAIQKIGDGLFTGITPSEIIVSASTVFTALTLTVTGLDTALTNWFAKAEYTRVN